MQDETIENTEIKKEINDKDVEYKQIRKDDIVVPPWVPRKMEMETQEDRNLGGSIKESGLINPLTVRLRSDGKYELIAGLRRFTTTNSEYVWASIQKNKSDFDAKVLCIGENYHRLDIDETDRDDLIYSTYRDGIKLGKLKNLRDMSMRTSITIDTLRKYINVGEERSKHKEDEIINRASTSAMYTTRNLKNVPIIRKKILDMETRKVLTQKRVSEITKRIETCVDKGMTEIMITKMMDMTIPIDQAPVSDNHIPVDNNINNDNNDNKKSNLPFNMDKFDNMSAIMCISPPDVREYIVSKKIALKDVGEINSFETVEARRQLVEEKIKTENWKKQSEESYDNQWKKNLEIRKIQETEVKDKGDTNLKTMFDIEHQRKLDLQSSKDDRRDQEYVRKYQNWKSDTLSMISIYHPRKVKDEDSKKIIRNIVREMYKLFRLVLIDIGDIKKASGTDFIDVEFNEKE